MNKQLIHITTDMNAELAALEMRLGKLKNDAPSVLVKAVNDVARKVRRQIIKDVKGEYVFQDKEKLKAQTALKMKSARKNRIEATLKSRGPMQDLAKFLVSPKTISRGMEHPPLYKAQVQKRSGLKALDGNPKPFITQFKSEHIAVAVRVPGKKMKKNPHRTFIKKLLSPAVPHMLGNPDIQAAAQAMVGDLLPQAVQKQIDKLLAQRGGEQA